MPSSLTIGRSNQEMKVKFICKKFKECMAMYAGQQ